MGTSYSVVFYYPEKNTKSLSKKDSLKIKSQIDARLNAIEQSMSTYREDSELSIFNKSPVGEWKSLSPELFKVIQVAHEVSLLSQGAFDITVGPLVNVWGFGPDYSLQDKPEAEVISALLKDKVGYQFLELDEQERRAKKHKALYIDLSAIAKGYAVDELALLLEQQGIANYLVEIGGELKASGEKTIHKKPSNKKVLDKISFDERNWRVAIEKPILDPLATQREIENILVLKNIAIASSGDYRNFFEAEGHIFSHTINPSTGWPVEHGAASVTVLHESCMRADALATAFMVMGLESSMAYANKNKLAVLLLIRKENTFEQHASDAMQSFIAQDL